jgi:hypothetical protein
VRRLHTPLIVMTLSQLLAKVPLYLKYADDSCTDEVLSRVDIAMREMIDGVFYASDVPSLIVCASTDKSR